MSVFKLCMIFLLRSIPFPSFATNVLSLVTLAYSSDFSYQFIYNLLAKNLLKSFFFLFYGINFKKFKKNEKNDTSCTRRSTVFKY
jgi:hypothetical protein